MDQFFIQLIVVAFLSAIPISEGMAIIRGYLQSIGRKLTLKPLPIRYSNKLLFKATVLMMEIGKGYALLMLIDSLTDIITDVSFEALILMTIACICHSWSPMRLFKVSITISPFIVGVLAMIDLRLVPAFLMGFVVVTLIFNSFTIGRLINIMLLFFWAFMLEIESLIPIIVIIISIESIRHIREIIDITENRPTSLAQIVFKHFQSKAH